MSNDDLKDMHADHKDKKDILLWSSVVPDSQKKRAHSPDPEENDKRARYDKYLDKMTEVEMIEAELAEKHSGGSFTDEQLRSWAHLIQMKKWGSYDTPPKKHFFLGFPSVLDRHLKFLGARLVLMVYHLEKKSTYEGSVFNSSFNYTSFLRKVVSTNNSMMTCSQPLWEM